MLQTVFSHVPSFLDLGAWTATQIHPLFRLFLDENVAPALALLLFSAALALCAFFLIECTFIRAQIWRGLRAVKKVKTKSEFSAARPKINSLMLKSRYLRHSWQKFCETLVEDPEDQKILNTTRPQMYFNTAEAGLRFPIYRAMPNLLVGIGLLLTFFGLVSALYFTTEAIKDARDIAASQAALRDLLHAASFKFYTSIAGLAGSIVMTLVLRYGTSKIDSVFDALGSVLESKLTFVTPESIALKHLYEAKEQTGNLKLFNTEVAVSIGRHIEEALANSLPKQLMQVMAPIVTTLNEVANKLTSMNQGAISDLAGAFAEKLEANTGEHLQSLAKTLGSLSSSLEDLNGRLSNSGSGLAENVSNSGEVMRDVVSSMGNTAQLIKDAAAPLAETSRLITDASQRIADATHSTEQIIVEAQNEVREIAKLMQTTLETTARQWEDYEKRFQGVDESLSSVLDQITKTVQANVESLGQFVEKIDEKFSGAIDRLGGGIEDLNEFAQSIEQSTSKLNGGTGQRVAP